MPVGSSSRTMATTRGPCSTTSGTRTFSTQSGTPKWRLTASRTFGGATKAKACACRAHSDPPPCQRVRAVGSGACAGVARPSGPAIAAGSAVPSITLAFSACAASIARIAAIACSSSSSLNDETPPECSTFISLGTNKAQIFRYAAGCVWRTFAMAFSPCLEKSLSNAQITASLSLLREPRSLPAGLPRKKI